jgi:hypothetical protein
MKKILLSAAAASLLAMPVFAQTAADRLSSDSEIRVQQEWEQLVAKVRGETPSQLAIGDVAAVTSSSATDAAPGAAKATSQQTAPTGRYQSTQDYWLDR